MTEGTIAHYRLLERCGQGAGGAVYRAEDTRLGRIVALKLLRADSLRDPDQRRRFLQEARAASRLQHPHLCTIHELGETADGQLYIAMSYYDGGSLADRLASGALAPAAVARIAGEVAAGLAHAHAAGIVHRDLKPANIMFDSGGRAVVVDFGLARLMDAETVTQDGSLLGTLMYMSPEQVRGEVAGPASDVWSLGVVLHEMLAGEKAFAGSSAAAVLAAITDREPAPPAVLRESEHVSLANLLRRCLQKDPRGRLAAVEIRDALRPASSAVADAGISEARTVVLPSSGLAARRRGRRRRATAVITVALVVVVAGWLFIRGGRGIRPGVALLPPVVMSESADDRALADGLVKDLTAALNLLEPLQDGDWALPAIDLRYAGVTGIESARGRLGAGTVVATTLQRQGDVLRLELVRHETLPRRWPQSDGPPASREVVRDGFELVGLAAMALAELVDLLGWRAPPPGHRPPGGTQVAAAMRAYLIGLGHVDPYAGEPALDTAHEAFREAVAADADFARAHAGLASTLRLGIAGHPPDPTGAVGAADRAISLAPDLVDGHLQRGLALRDLARFDAAVAAFAAAARVAPDHALALHHLGEALAVAGRTAAADSVLAGAVARRPLYMAAHADLGVHLLTSARVAEAEPVFRRVVAIAPTFVDGLVNLGNTYYFLDRWTEAKAQYQRALALAPDAYAYQNLGTIYFYEARYPDATLMYEKAIELDPADHYALSSAAECYHWSDSDRDRARRYWSRAAAVIDSLLVAAPGEVSLQVDLASCRAMTGDGERARELVAAALPRVEDRETWFKVATVQEQLGDREGALRSLARALEAGMPVHHVGRYPGLDRLRASGSYAEMLAGLEYTTR